MKKRKIFRLLAFVLSAMLMFNSFGISTIAFADEDVAGAFEEEPETQEEPSAEPEQPSQEPSEPATEKQSEPATEKPSQEQLSQEQPSQQPSQEQPSQQPSEQATEKPSEKASEAKAQLQAIAFPGVKFEITEGDELPVGKSIKLTNPNNYDVTTTVAIAETKDAVDFQVSDFPGTMGANGDATITIVPKKNGTLSAGNYNATLSITAKDGDQTATGAQSIQLVVNKKAEEPSSEEPSSEAKSEEKSSEAKSEEKSSEAKSEEKSSESKSEEKKSEEKSSEAKSEEKKSSEAPSEDKKKKPVVDSVRVSPGEATLKAGGNTTFSAKVYGDYSPSQSVTWSVSGGTGGTKITGDGTLIVDQNETATQLKVIAKSVENTSVTGDATVKITKDSKQVTKTVTVVADPAGAGQVAGGGSYKPGDTVTMSAIANNGYKFTGWVLNGTSPVSGAGNTYQIKMGEENISYVAKFQRVSCNVNVSVNNDSRGKVSGGGTVEYGGSMTLKAETKDDNRFTGWKENDKIISKDKELKLTNITTDRNIQAVFDKKGVKVTINKNINEGGQVSGDGTYNNGDTVKVSVSIANGYRFDGWYLNNQKVSNAMEYKIENVDRDLNFTAMFYKNGQKMYTITSGVAQQGKGGVISPQGATYVQEGSSFTYVIAPGNGYKILAVAVDGQQVGAVKTYTFTNVTSDHTIAVAFAPDSNAVVKKSMEKIITTAEAAAIASAKLEAGNSTEGRSSVINEAAGTSTATSNSGTSTKTTTTKSNSNSSGGSSTENKPADPVIEETISVEDLDKDQENNLIGMDGAENITETSVEDLTFATGIYATLGTTPEMAQQMVDSGDDMMLLKTAYDDGYLKVNINNQYSKSGGFQDIDSANPLESNATIKNIGEFVQGVLTSDEKMYMFDGNEVSLNLDISQSEPSSDTKKLMDSLKGVKPVGFFDITFMKSEMDLPQVVTETPVEMELVLKVPDDMKQDSGKLCIVREHNGEVEVLEDLDNDPDTITVRTSKFSSYAFAYEGGKSAVNWILIVVIAAVMVAVLAVAIVVITRSRKAAVNRNRRKEN
ncbi:MAG: hypothetical protein K6G42_11295 [Lachnospiraceae bacterium]|nr:hypothetical protein [Lachnospiraceae bacterium]